MSVEESLRRLRDEKNAAFMANLLPNITPETVLGARMGDLRALAGRLRDTEEAARFLEALPHALYEENLLHALLISDLRSYDESLAALERFLPFVDNWAVCDALRPRPFARHRAELPEQIRGWMASDAPFIRRFGLEMLMVHYLDGDFAPEYLDWAAEMRGGDYYANMMIAWYFATALAKQYDATLPVLEQNRLEKWTHNKTIQKAVESFRVSEEHKAYLKTLRR